MFQEEPFNVVWRFSPDAAPHAEEYMFHPSQQMEKEKDGSLVVRFCAGGKHEMIWHLYSTLTATNGKEALALLEGADHVDLLFSDVVMPGDMDGYNLAKAVSKDHPGVKVLLTSGFTSKREGALNGDRAMYAELSKHLLNKPYNQQELACAIRQALDNGD